MSDDILTALTSGQPQSQDQIQAIVQQLRNRGQLGQLAAMSGDPSLAPFGQKILAENQSDQKQLGEQQIQNQSEDLRNKQYQRMLDQGQGALAETIRYHNMEDQERKDKLDQQKAAIGNPDQFQATISRIGSYDLPMPANRSAHNAALIDAVSQQYPDYDATKYAAKQKAQKDFSTGPQGNMVRSAPVSLQHLDLADQKADLLQNTNFPAWNAIKNTAGPWFGNTTIAKGVAGLDTAKTIVSDEIDRFFINGGGALEDRKALKDKLANANSPPALHEVTDTLRQLMAGQMNGLRSQYEDNVPGGNFIADKVKHQSVLDTLGWDGNSFTGRRGSQAAPGGAPAQGSGPPPSAVPGAPQAPPGGSGSGAPGAAPSAISPFEAQLRQSTGSLANGQAAPPTALVDNRGIVRTGRRNGKRVGQLADGTIVPLE
jgi:hypothetical protein